MVNRCYLFFVVDHQTPHRKILEDLTLKKQLLKSGAAQTLNPGGLNSAIGIPVINQANVNPENQMSNITRTALQHANSNSFGYFIPQESAFGYNILAVLPRFDQKP